MKQQFVIIVGVDTGENDAGYGVMTKKSYDRWVRCEVEPDIKDRFGLLYGKSELVDTYDTWAGAMQLVADVEGEVVDVHACLAY